jgi:hypothetical protein
MFVASDVGAQELRQEFNVLTGANYVSLLTE